MNNIELTSFLITIISSTVSISLAVFAIWLSKHFDNKSSVALEKVNELSVEIKTQVAISLNNQKDFSGKMLDKILSKSEYGEKKSTSGHIIEDTMNQQLKEMEEKFLNKLDSKINDLEKLRKDDVDLINSVNQIRVEFKEFADETSSSVMNSFNLPEAIYDNKRFFQNFPAHILLLTAIVKENLHSFDDMKSNASKYNFPDDWEIGLENLLEREIIIGDEDSFDLPTKYSIGYAIWIERNRDVIDKLITHYKNKEEDGSVTEFEMRLAKKVIF